MKKIAVLVLLCACTNPSSMNSQNELSNSSSPYLQQHAENPVHWKEWSAKTLSKALEQDKPILVSIGYSSCHWCHVMEKESFEDTAVARLMNENFINIKVDREERPDVDQIYMDAVQTMGLNGGWPLNVFLTPDQKPFYGGTYFPRDGWVNLLTNINEAFENNREKINESAEAFTENLRLNETVKYKLEGKEYKLSSDEIDSAYQLLAANFDTVDGGVKKSPKFPMPAVWQYLSTHHLVTNNQQAKDHLIFTLEKIASGGIYDHIGGGFARYSTDEEWHVPHFEKMLYDNGQLLSLYANAYKLSKKSEFKEVILETISWLKREMLDESFGFYAALDADSEGQEGKFYVWQFEEVRELVPPEHLDLIVELYDIKPSGNWEGTNVLRVIHDRYELIEKFEINPETFASVIRNFKESALASRNKRIRPGLDDKIIAGWNGLALSGLLESYQALQDSSILLLAEKNASFIRRNMVKNGMLQRFPNQDMEGFLEDYAAVIQAFIKYYETTLDQSFLATAYALLDRVEEQFYDDAENLYFFTGNEAQGLIARKKELFDNVIPSSNSIMAWNLVHLGTHFYNDQLVEKGKSIVAQVRSLILEEPEYMSNWAQLSMELSSSFAEIVVIGPEASSFVNEINQLFLPNKIVTGSMKLSENPPFTAKSLMNDQTTIYVCFDKSCKRPVNSVAEALEQL